MRGDQKKKVDRGGTKECRAGAGGRDKGSSSNRKPEPFAGLYNGSGGVRSIWGAGLKVKRTHLTK